MPTRSMWFLWNGSFHGWPLRAFSSVMGNTGGEMKSAKKKLIDRFIQAYRAAKDDAERMRVLYDARACGVTMEALLGRKRR